MKISFQSTSPLPGGEARAVKYSIRNKQKQEVGKVVLEVQDGWPTTLLDIETKENERGNRYAEYVSAAVANDAGELHVWHIIPSARTWWVRQGATPIDQYDGTLTFAQYADARAGRDNPRGMGQGVNSAGRSLKQVNRGAFNPDTIALSKGADLSTFLHKSGHFFLETLADIAGRENAPASIQKDLADVLQWRGVADIAAWHNLDFEEKRSYH